MLNIALIQLRSVLCDPSGRCCIAGSDEDRRIVDMALDALGRQAGDLPAASPETKGFCNDERSCANCFSDQGGCLNPAPAGLDDSALLDWLVKSDWYVGPEWHADEAGGAIGYDNKNCGSLRDAIRAARGAEVTP